MAKHDDEFEGRDTVTLTLDDDSELEWLPDYAKDAISEFLNLSNGLYNVNISETTGKEIGLNPQETATSSAVNGIKSKFTLTIPVEYTFGTVVFTLAVI